MCETSDLPFTVKTLLTFLTQLCKMMHLMQMMVQPTLQPNVAAHIKYGSTFKWFTASKLTMMFYIPHPPRQGTHRWGRGGWWAKRLESRTSRQRKRKNASGCDSTPNRAQLKVERKKRERWAKGGQGVGGERGRERLREGRGTAEISTTQGRRKIQKKQKGKGDGMCWGELKEDNSRTEC